MTTQGSEYTNEVLTKLKQAGYAGYWLDASSALRMTENSVIVLDPINLDVIAEALTDGVNIPPVKSTRRKARWSDNGCEVEMQRVWSGQFDQAFRRTTRESAKAPSKIRIVCENAVTGGTDATSAFWTGAAAVALADILSAAGHNVEIVNVLNLTNQGQRIRAWLVIKDSQTPMSIASVAGTTALIGFFRCIGLAWFTGLYKSSCGSGMGTCENITLKHVIRPDVDRTYLASYADVLSQDSARDWIKSALADFD